MLKCIPYHVPSSVQVGQTTTIDFGIQNLYNETINAIVFIADCDGYSNCSNYNIIWHSKVITIPALKTVRVKIDAVFKKTGYFGIGVYNLNYRRGECGFIIQVTSGGGGIPNPFAWFGNLLNLIIGLMVLSLVLNLIKPLIGTLFEAVKGR